MVVSLTSGGGWLYSGGTLRNLDAPIDPAAGLSIYDAAGINDLGQIVGTACDAFGECGAVLLNPVPEPETYGMMLAGLGVVGYAARRRKSRANSS